MHHFTATELLPGVHHIRDGMGVFMTLLTGSERALLVDCGYGLEDVHAFVRTLTDKPLTVLLTHAHHDHALGAKWFRETMMLPADQPYFPVYTSQAQRRQVALQAENKGLDVPEDFLTAAYTAPADALPGPIDLGGLTAEVIPCPAHTPGSAVVYVPERSLLLTGDDWNPCAWAFFPEALGAEDFRRNVTALYALPFRHVICSHREELHDRSAFEAFFDGLTDDVLQSAKPVNMGRPLDTREASPAPDQIFVFDYGKTAFAVREEQA